MALKYRILSDKTVVPTLNVYPGSQDLTDIDTSCIDLLTKVINNDIKVSGTFIMVNKSYIARPDLISLAVYGTDEYADILCKVNGISNPFELNENDLLFIPDVETIQALRPTVIIPNKFIIDDNNSLIGDWVNTSGRSSNNSLQKQRDQKRSPNEQVVGDRNYVIDHSTGIIIY